MMSIGRRSGATAERAERCRLAAWPMGAIGMVALIVAVEAFVAAHDAELISLGTYTWRYSDRVARGEARDCQVLCLGSSLTKCGVLARVVGHETGRTCLNMAVGNGRITSSYYLLKHALEAGARPAAILIDYLDGPIDPNDRHELSEGLASNWRNWPEILTLRDAVELAAAQRSADFLNAMLLGRVLPSYRTRFEIRAMVKAIARREKIKDWRLWFQFTERNWEVNCGTLVTDGAEASALAQTESPSSEAAAGAGPPAPGSGSLVGDRLSEIYVRRLLELAEARGITVFWVLPPMHPIARAGRISTGHDAYFARVARDVVARFPNAVVIDGRNAGYPASRFPDRIHLGTPGGYTHSAELAAIVRRHLAAPAAGSRWYELPRYRDRPMEITTEDMSTSARFVLRTIRAEHARRQADLAARDGKDALKR